MIEIQEAESQQCVQPAPPVVADAPFSSLATRMHQMFPDLSWEEVDRLRKFGEVRHFQPGELLFETGEIGPGMYVMLAGRVRIYQRDGLGRERVVSEQGVRKFLAEVGQL